MAPAIPDRWLNYTPIGKRIEGTRFIAFKVPLRKHIVESVDNEMRLDISSLLRKVPNLGIIIDLTNTNRYYDPDYFRREGVEHKKLMIPGHVTPPDNLVNQFKLYVMSFLNSNKDNDKLIGVHCTHGVNRTGYLICNYMISEMTMDPKDAIKRFDTARGHHIERRNYLEALDSSLRTNIQSDENHGTYLKHHTDSEIPRDYRNNKTDRGHIHHHEPVIRHERRHHHADSSHSYRRTYTSSSAYDRNSNYHPSTEEFTRRNSDYVVNRNNRLYNYSNKGRRNYHSSSNEDTRSSQDYSVNRNSRPYNFIDPKKRDDWTRSRERYDHREKIRSPGRTPGNHGDRCTRDYL